MELSAKFYIESHHYLNEYEDLIQKQGVTPSNKAGNEKRIFILGESAARGVPYTLDSSFSGLLNRLIRDAGQGTVKVINASVPGRHSFYQKEVGKLLLRYKADAVILYAGNNDTRDFSNVMRDVPLALIDFRLSCLSNFYRFLKRRMHKFGQVLNRIAKKNVFTQNYNQDDFWHWTDVYLKKKKEYLENPLLGQKRKMRAIDDFETNLSDLVRELIRHGTAVYIMELPVVHKVIPGIGDWPRKGYTFTMRVPFKDLHEARRWKRYFYKGRRFLKKKQFSDAIENLSKTEAINSIYPALYHTLGEAYEGKGDFETAKRMYALGKDLQIQSGGGDSFKNSALKRIAETYGVPFVATQQALESVSPNGIVGKNLFLDHCHPNVFGHKILAALAMESLCRQKALSCDSSLDWQSWLEKLLQGKLNDQNMAREYLMTAFYLFNGTSWSTQPDYKEALYYFEKSRDLLPSNKEVYPYLSAAYWQVGNAAMAEQSLEQLKGLDAQLYQKTFSDFPYLLKLRRDHAA